MLYSIGVGQSVRDEAKTRTHTLGRDMAKLMFRTPHALGTLTEGGIDVTPQVR